MLDGDLTDLGRATRGTVASEAFLRDRREQSMPKSRSLGVQHAIARDGDNDCKLDMAPQEFTRTVIVSRSVPTAVTGLKLDRGGPLQEVTHG